MYLAVHRRDDRKWYTIRESWYDEAAGCLASRDLVELGPSPGRCIVYPGRHGFYIAARIGEQLEALGVEFDLCELEELFWPFVKRIVREAMEPFHCRDLAVKARVRGRNPLAGRERLTPFDERRLYFLRYGDGEPVRMSRVARKYLKALAGKGRDEIEQYFLGLEQVLDPRLYKRYVYDVFDLKRHFPGPLGEIMPYALDGEELDRVFDEELCRLHRDRDFIAGLAPAGRLDEYLGRYVVMFFDYRFSPPETWQEFLRDFRSSWRQQRAPAGRGAMSKKEAITVFGVSEAELAGMSKREITRLFRQKAHELHPDKGGDQDAFIRLTEAYQALVGGRKGRGPG